VYRIQRDPKYSPDVLAMARRAEAVLFEVFKREREAAVAST